MSGAWQAFYDELARWRDDGRTAEFWWRDDDAARPDAALSRLLALAQGTSTPLALAVIPLRCVKEIFENAGAFVSVLQHGTDHANRAGAGDKKTEFSAGEAPAAAVARLIAARAVLGSLAGERLLPVLVPPWNRLPEQLAKPLANVGYRGRSQFGARADAEAAPGLRQVNTHVDIIAWHSGRGFVGEEPALAAATRHLAAKRVGAVDPDEATGWLTHHLLHDEAAWSFLERLFESTRGRPAVAWRRPEELFHIP